MRLPLLGTAASPAVHEITEADLAPINLMYYLPSINYELCLNSLVALKVLQAACFTLKYFLTSMLEFAPNHLLHYMP